MCLAVIVACSAPWGCAANRATATPAGQERGITRDQGASPDPAVTEVALQPAEPAPPATLTEESAYTIGADDELAVSVYGEADLSKTQTVRPDGKIAFPLIGDVQASGLTPDELREQITEKLAKFVRNPRVTVIVSAYKSKKVSVLGEVRYPGVVPLSFGTTLLEGISRAGGVTENADLEGALLVRKGHVVRVSFDKLLHGGDFDRNNLPLESSDFILIPSVAAKKVYVLGEVKRPLVTSLRYGVNLVEVIALAGGFTLEAERKNVLVIRGGLGDPTIMKVNVDAITKRGVVDQNLALKAGDIVYAPRSLIADVDRFFQHLSTWLQPIVMAETGIILGPSVKDVLTTGTQTGTSVVVSP
jgi:polysaccharide export outer membrane protein